MGKDKNGEHMHKEINVEHIHKEKNGEHIQKENNGHKNRQRGRGRRQKFHGPNGQGNIIWEIPLVYLFQFLEVLFLWLLNYGYNQDMEIILLVMVLGILMVMSNLQSHHLAQGCLMVPGDLQWGVVDRLSPLILDDFVPFSPFHVDSSLCMKKSQMLYSHLCSE